MKDWMKNSMEPQLHKHVLSVVMGMNWHHHPGSVPRVAGWGTNHHFEIRGEKELSGRNYA
jgi:hypothetical protein